MWQDRLSALSENDTLQTWPVGVAFFGLDSFDVAPPKVANRGIDGADTAPGGCFLGALISTPLNWQRGDLARFGPFEGNLWENREYLFVVVEPARWSSFSALELRIHRYSDHMKDDFIPDDAAARATGHASRETVWSRLSTELPATVFTDGQCGLALKATDGALVMDWYHRRAEDVFSEMKSRKFMRTVLAPKRIVETASKGWFAARPTKFGL